MFRTHGKVYETTASQMFGLPLEKIQKSGLEYNYRRKGKVATLALGYQDGTDSLINLGALDNGLMGEKLPNIVSRWHGANPAIVQFWHTVEAVGRQIRVKRNGE